IFAPTFIADGATANIFRNLVEPVIKSFKEDKQSWTPYDWSINALLGDSATKVNLVSRLTGTNPPSLLFIASHGLFTGKMETDAKKMEIDGSIVTGEWTGFGPIENNALFSASDISSESNITGSIVFAFAVDSAGKPKYDDFDTSNFYDNSKNESILTDHDRLSNLPMKLLGLPERGALAF